MFCLLYNDMYILRAVGPMHYTWCIQQLPLSSDTEDGCSLFGYPEQVGSGILSRVSLTNELPYQVRPFSDSTAVAWEQVYGMMVNLQVVLTQHY